MKHGTWNRRLTARNREGFSLLELLIYVAVLSIVMVMISSTFIALNRGSSQSEIRSEVNSNLRFAIEKIGQDVRAASSVSTPATAGATSTTLVLMVSSATTTYDVSSGQLRRQVGTSTPEVLTSDAVTVNTPVFTRLENTNTVLGKTIVSIEADLTIQNSGTSPDETFSARKRTTVSLR